LVLVPVQDKYNYLALGAATFAASVVVAVVTMPGVKSPLKSKRPGGDTGPF
jgi:hypothetical protein